VGPQTKSDMDSYMNCSESRFALQSTETEKEVGVLCDPTLKFSVHVANAH